MTTRLSPADVRTAADALRAAADALRAGKLVAFPTETVYGLGANALDPVAIARIFAAKGRPTTNPLIVHVADASELPAVASEVTPLAVKLIAAFWPGPLTLVLPKNPAVPDAVTAGGPTVAVRCPAHPLALELLRAAGVPVAAPSANRSGELSPTTADHVLASLDGRIDFVLDGGPCPGGLESTVLDVTGPVPRLLRPGLVSLDQLRAVVGEVLVGPATDAGPARSPGLMTKHYAPRAALECAATDTEREFLANLYETAGLKVARYTLPESPEAAAARLYADLHALDAIAPDRILVTLPPDIPAWAAVRDRLQRASAEE
jgi:L-threonylcarbamoyladenylate synthase